MSRTVEMSFNVENRTFSLGYLNYEVDKSVRKAVVHTYYVSIDTRLTQFIEFLVTISPEQARQSKIDNVRQIMLKVTFAKGQVFYNLIIKGSTTGVMTFKPSEFKNCEEESNFSDVEHLITSIINEEEKPVPTYHQLSFHLTSELHNFKVNYSDYDYFTTRRNHMYDLVVDPASLELLQFLRVNYSSMNRISSSVDEMYIRISEKKKIASLVIYGTNDSKYEQIDFVPAKLEDSNPNNSLPKFSLPFNEPVPKWNAVTAVSSNIKQQIVSVCKEIADSRNQTTEKIEQLRQLLTSLSVLDEKKKEPQFKEEIQRVYKKQRGVTATFVHVGVKDLNNKIVFSLPVRSESRCKDVQNTWNIYQDTFYYQPTKYYEDGSTKVGTMKQFVPSNKIQEIESSDRTGVIGCLIQAARLAEIIYYDCYVE